MSPKIILRHDPKPIPDRNFDWEARYFGSDLECGAVGFGSNADEATDSLTKEFPWDGAE